MPGSSNFLQWNPLAANQENDIQYGADAMRTGGATTNAIFASPLANKLFYQVSTMVAALALALANKGYVVSDSNFANLVSLLGNLVTNADVKPNMIHVPFSSAPVCDCSQANGFRINLSGPTATPSVINATFGQRICFFIQQDSFGGRVWNWPSNVLVAGTVFPGALEVSIQEFVVNDDGNLWPIGPMVGN